MTDNELSKRLSKIGYTKSWLDYGILTIEYLNEQVQAFDNSDDQNKEHYRMPYHGRTNDDPALIKKNLDKLESVALPLFRKGHIPMIGEWVALPLMDLAGSKEIGDSIWDEIQHPIAHRLLEKCDAVLRLEGASKGADEDVRIAKERGLKIYYSLGEIPDLTQK